MKLQFWNDHELTAEWPCPRDIALAPLVAAIDRVAQFHRRFGVVMVTCVDDENVSHVVGKWNAIDRVTDRSLLKGVAQDWE